LHVRHDRRPVGRALPGRVGPVDLREGGIGLKQLAENQVYEIRRNKGGYIFGNSPSSGMPTVYARFCGFVGGLAIFRSMSGWELSIREVELDEHTFRPVSRERAEEAWQNGDLYGRIEG